VVYQNKGLDEHVGCEDLLKKLGWMELIDKGRKTGKNSCKMLKCLSAATF
jgi:hypothetical protein